MENKDILYKLYRLLNGMAITHPLPPLERGDGYSLLWKLLVTFPLSRGGRGCVNASYRTKFNTPLNPLSKGERVTPCN